MSRVLAHLNSPAEAAHTSRASSCAESPAARELQITLLSGGGDKPYALGLVEALAAQGIGMDFVGSDQLDCPQLRNEPRLNFLNLRGDQRPNVGVWQKAVR